MNCAGCVEDLILCFVGLLGGKIGVMLQHNILS